MRHPYPYYRASLRDFGKRRVRGCAGRAAWATANTLLNIPTPCPPRWAVLVDQGRGLAGRFHPGTSGSLSVRDATAPAMSGASS